MTAVLSPATRRPALPLVVTGVGAASVLAFLIGPFAVNGLHRVTEPLPDPSTVWPYAGDSALSAIAGLGSLFAVAVGIWLVVGGGVWAAYAAVRRTGPARGLALSALALAALTMAALASPVGTAAIDWILD